MLVLSRNVGTSIIINGNITVTVLEYNRGQVRLGIDAPRDVDIVREELIANRDPAENEQQRSKHYLQRNRPRGFFNPGFAALLGVCAVIALIVFWAIPALFHELNKDRCGRAFKSDYGAEFSYETSYSKERGCRVKIAGEWMGEEEGWRTLSAPGPKPR